MKNCDTTSAFKFFPKKNLKTLVVSHFFEQEPGAVAISPRVQSPSSPNMKTKCENMKPKCENMKVKYEAWMCRYEAWAGLGGEGPGGCGGCVEGAGWTMGCGAGWVDSVLWVVVVGVGSGLGGAMG